LNKHATIVASKFKIFAEFIKAFEKNNFVSDYLESGPYQLKNAFFGFEKYLMTETRISTNPRDSYYTNENVALDIHNDEDEDEAAEVTAQIKLLGRPESTRLSWIDDAASSEVDFEIEISLIYYLVTDMETPLSKTMTIDLSFITTFGAKFQLLPHIHPRPWPNFLL
jgi:gryzun protein (putative trafficking through Golgi)